MTDKPPDNQESGALLKVLTAHYRALVSARSDEPILRQYASLLRFLKSKPPHFLDERGDARSHRSRPVPTIIDVELRKASLDDLEKIVSDANGTCARRKLKRFPPFGPAGEAFLAADRVLGDVSCVAALSGRAGCRLGAWRWHPTGRRSRRANASGTRAAGAARRPAESARCP